MKTQLLSIAAAGACVIGLFGFNLAANASPPTGSVTTASVATTGLFQPVAWSRQGESIRGERADGRSEPEGSDDDRPYRSRFRQSDDRDQQRRGRGRQPTGPQCAGYADADDDGICDDCARTPKGCSAARGAPADSDPYAGMPTIEDYERQTTLANMQTAFNGESNAHAKYVAYAMKADEEGFAGVAALFRAAAQAEGVHRDNHAEVIRQLNATPKATIEDIRVGKTRENLADAIAGESYEWDVMYPGMLGRARLDRDRAALRSFNFAMTAERAHGRFYRAALADLESWQTPRTFFVCTVCGETVDTIDFKKCPSCFVSADEYIEVK